jgi:hypothetical protein
MKLGDSPALSPISGVVNMTIGLVIGMELVKGSITEL